MRRSKAEWTTPLLVFYEKFGKIEAIVFPCCNLEGRLKIKFAPLCQFNFIKNQLDYRGLSVKMRFVSWSFLLLNATNIRKGTSVW